MKLAVVETAPYGGLLHYAFQLADALARDGNEVDLIAARDNELEDFDSAARMVAVLTPPVRSQAGPPSGRIRDLVRRAIVATRLFRAWVRIAQMSRRGGYEAVVINCGIHATVVGVIVGLMNRIPGGPPIAHICHDVRPFGKSRDKLFRGWVLLDRAMRWAYTSFPLVFVHGERSRKEFEEIWGGRRLAMIPHGDERIFAGQAPPEGDEERILFFGNWAVVKGIPVLMRAFDQIVERRPGVRLTLAGSPNPQEVDIEEVRRWAAGRPEVELREGYVPLAEVPALFGSARVVAIPYLVGFQSGIVHLAMTMGRAVVATDVGDISSAVGDGETGILIPPGDAEALADALERVVSDPALARRLGEEGRRRVLSSSSWETVAKRVETELREVV